MTRSIIRISIVVAVLLAGAGAAHAAADSALARGFTPNAAYHLNDFDSVNIYNGNLAAHVPLGHEYATNGALRYSFGLSYNSHIWDYYNQTVVGSIQYGIQLSWVASVYQIDPNDLPTGGGENGTESVPFGNAGIGWNFSLGDLRGTWDIHPGSQGISYVAPDGSEVDFAYAMHGPEPATGSNVLYSTSDPVLRMRMLSVPNAPPAREIDFPDGTRKHFTCVDKCTDRQDAQWNLDWISDPFGNFLAIDRTDVNGQPAAKRPTSGQWIWTYREGTLLHTDTRQAPYYYTDADHDYQIIRHHVATFSVSHGPWELRLEKLDLAAFTPATIAGAGERRAVYLFHYNDNALIYRDTVLPWSRPDTRVPYATPDGKIAVSTLTSVDLPNGGPGGDGDTGAGNGSKLGRWAFTYYDGSEEPRQAITIGTQTIYTSHIAGRVRRVTPPTSRAGGYEYTYTHRGFPVRPCHNPGGPLSASPTTPLTAVATRQQLADNGAPLGSAWIYSGQAHLEPPDSSGCRTPREFIAAVMDPFGTISMSFYSVDLNAQNDYGKPFTPLETDAVNHDGTVRYLSGRTFQATRYSDFLALGDTLAGVLATFRAGGDVSSYGSFLRSTYALYEDSDSECGLADPTGNCYHKYLRRLSEHTRYHDDPQYAASAYTESVNSDYDGLGHYRRNDAYGNFAMLGTGASSFEKRTTYSWFNSAVGTFTPTVPLPAGAPAAGSPWLLETYASKTVVDGGRGTTTLFTFDPSRGFMTQQRVTTGTSPAGPHLLTSTSPKDLITNFRRTEGSDEGGPVTTVAEDHLGGDLATGEPTVPEYTVETTFQFGAKKTTLYRDCAGNVGYIAEQNQVDPGSGLVRSIADSAGIATVYDYDRLDRVLKVTPSGEAPQTYTFTSESTNPLDNSGTNSLTIDRTGTQVAGGHIAYTYDHLGRLQRQSQTLPNGGANQKVTKYDVLGRKLSETIAGDAGASSDGFRTTSYTYDGLGRVTQVKRPDNETTTETYFGARSVNHSVSDIALTTGSQSVVTTDFYDSFGRVSRVNDNAARADYTYDPEDRLLSVETWVSGQGGASVQRRYFDYDGRGLLVGERHPEMLQDFSSNTYVELHHTYDSMGHPLTNRYINDAQAAAAFDLDFDYDFAGRLFHVLSPYIPAGATDRPLVKQFKYNKQSATYGAAAGKLASASRYTYTFDPAATRHQLTYTVQRDFTYDPVTGRIGTVKVSSPNSNVAAVTSYAYDELGELARTTYAEPQAPMNVTATHRIAGNRFNRGFLTGVDYGSTLPLTPFLNLGYHVTGLVNDVCFVNGGSGCVSHDTMAVDTTGMARPASMSWMYGGGTTLSTGAYSYDGAGNISAIGTDQYLYDKAGRLARATIGSTSASPQRQDYSYDAAGNLLSLPPSTTTPADPNPVDIHSNRLHAATYDGAGHLKSLPVNRPSLHTTVQLNFRYDYSGALVYYGSTGISRSFVYDDEDERVAVIDSRAGDGTHERWSLRGLDHKVLRDFERYNGVWSWKKDYLYRDGTAAGTIGAATTGEEVHQLHVDHLGTVRIVTTSGGTLFGGTAGAYPQKYWPFGDPLIAGTLADRLVFTGHERDDDGTLDTQADLDYMHARYYAPVAGRFLTMDPTFGSAQLLDPQSWNRYGYVRNNPVGHTDPDGRIIDTLADIAFIGYDVYDIGHSLIKGEGVSGTQGLALAADVGAAFVPFVTGAGAAVRLAAHTEGAVHTVEGAAHLAKESGEILSRLGRSEESAARLGRKAAEAEDKIGIHGVSTSAAKPTAEASQAARSSVEKQFRVHNTPTKADPLHRTVELPKPVTREIADAFNRLFGRLKD